MKPKSDMFIELLGVIYQITLCMAFTVAALFTVTALVQLYHGNYYEASALLVAGCFSMRGGK